MESQVLHIGHHEFAFFSLTLPQPAADKIGLSPKFPFIPLLTSLPPKYHRCIPERGKYPARFLPSFVGVLAAMFIALAKMRPASVNSFRCTLTSRMPHTRRSHSISSRDFPKSQCSESLRSSATNCDTDSLSLCDQELKL